VCQGYRPPPDFTPSIEVPLSMADSGMAGSTVSFIACGDLGSFDSDATYQNGNDQQSLDPVQSPTAPVG